MHIKLRRSLSKKGGEFLDIYLICKNLYVFLHS
jgi:hypothetical protein